MWHALLRQALALRASHGLRAVLCEGGPTLNLSLLAAGLVDEIRTFTFPVVLGKGKRLFGTGTIPGTLKLVESKASPSGVTINTYERAGDVKVGSFAHEQPSAEELQRRERMKREG